MTNQGDEVMFRVLAIATVLAAALLLPQAMPMLLKANGAPFIAVPEGRTAE
jgi:hypothetical protein